MPNEKPHGQYHHAHELVEGLHALRGFHPGYRTVHALGRIYRGTFTASGDGAALTRAVHFQPGATVPATARFSSSAADPAPQAEQVAADHEDHDQRWRQQEEGGREAERQWRS